MSGRGRNAVQYVQNDEPSFIKQFKQKIGYKEGPGVETKRQRAGYELEDEEDDEREEREDEQPVVVCLTEQHLTAEEARQVSQQQQQTAASVESVAGDSKITFKKPGKRALEEEGTTMSGKKEKDTERTCSKVKKVKNSSLLSFGDEEEEGED